MKTIVVALGGNALLGAKEKPSIKAQQKNVQKAMQAMLVLFRSKNNIVLTHGNGPQVGNILLQVESALGKAYSVPLEVAVAESQGEIGFLLQQEMLNLFSAKKIKRSAVSILTQVLVDKKDSAFKSPSKPIGPFYSKEKAIQLKRKGFDVIEDSGRGFRRVVASPSPIQIIEKKTIAELVAKGIVVIAAGGGGIPVVREHGKLKGVPAVIDKDLASSCLAEEIGASMLVILTGVDNAFTDFGTSSQKPLFKISVKQAKHFLAKGEFGHGSMEPKVRAAIKFVQKTGKQAIITSPRKLELALAGKAGTIIAK